MSSSEKRTPYGDLGGPRPNQNNLGSQNRSDSQEILPSKASGISTPTSQDNQSRRVYVKSVDMRISIDKRIVATKKKRHPLKMDMTTLRHRIARCWARSSNQRRIPVPMQQSPRMDV
jgi:hypothetical protein